MKAFSKILAAVALLGFGACQPGNQQSGTDEPVSVETTVTPYATDIVTTSVTDDNGNTLDMRFDNIAGTATFLFGGDTIYLKQDTMASGIRYSNDNYIFTEHQGEVTLTKDGDIVFTKDN